MGIASPLYTNYKKLKTNYFIRISYYSIFTTYAGKYVVP